MNSPACSSTCISGDLIKRAQLCVEGVSAPKMFRGRIQILLLGPHAEVVWAACGHILLAVCK